MPSELQVLDNTAKLLQSIYEHRVATNTVTDGINSPIKFYEKGGVVRVQMDPDNTATLSEVGVVFDLGSRILASFTGAKPAEQLETLKKQGAFNPDKVKDIFREIKANPKKYEPLVRTLDNGYRTTTASILKTTPNTIKPAPWVK